MKMYTTPQPVEKYLNVELECDCGRTHYAPIKAVNIGKGALASLPGYVKEYGYKHPYMLCDSITYEVAGKKCEEYLRENGIECYVLILRHLGFDEATLGEIVINKPQDCDLMIGVGTGSITDMTRFSSFKLKLPCFTVATGAPMDGFTASVGIMNVNNLKATMPAHCTDVIIGDTDVLQGAPFRMTLAGYADLIAKVHALNDWRLDALINSGHYCKNLDVLVSSYVDKAFAEADKLKTRDPETIGDVLNGLLMTGTVISLYGVSRPVSGAEHHMSHYWEVVGEQQGKRLAMHGEQVAVGTVLMLRVCEMVLEFLKGIGSDCGNEEEKAKAVRVFFENAREKAAMYDRAAWEAEVHRAYGSAAESIIELENKSRKNDPENSIRRINAVEEKLDDVKKLLAALPSPDRVRSLYKDLGCPCEPQDIDIDPLTMKDTVIYAKETRGIYTVLQLAWDLGILNTIADRITGELHPTD